MIPNQWYAIHSARDVGAEPLGVRRMGVDLVLFRGRDGRIACLRDRCPHKGVKLSRGSVRDGHLQCAYHGFRYDTDGQCVRMPVIGAAGRIPKTMCTPSYIVRERFGLVWLWWGEARAEDALPAIRMWPVFERPSRADAELSWEQPVHYTRYVESLTEGYHVPYVHSASRIERLFNIADARVDHLTVEGDGHVFTSRFMLREDSDRSDVEVLADWRPWRRALSMRIDVMMPNLNYYDMPFPYGGIRAHVLIVSAPIDEQRTWAVFRYRMTGGNALARSLPVRKLLSKLSCDYERSVAQPDDIRLLQEASPRRASLEHERFGAFDRLVIEYLKQRKRLLAADADARPLRVLR